MEYWQWIVFGLGLLVVEILVPGGLFALFFGAGAIVVGALTWAGAAGPPSVQWLIFSVLSLLALALLRRRLRARLSPPRRPMDTLVGEGAVPMEDLAAGGTGKAELRGTLWDARNGTPLPLSRGQRCLVERVEGLMIWIRPETPGEVHHG